MGKLAFLLLASRSHSKNISAKSPRSGMHHLSTVPTLTKKKQTVHSGIFMNCYYYDFLATISCSLSSLFPYYLIFKFVLRTEKKNNQRNGSRKRRTLDCIFRCRTVHSSLELFRIKDLLVGLSFLIERTCPFPY